MKKLLILLLALVMCLTALTSCDQVLGMFWQPEAPQPEEPEVVLTDADLAIQYLNTLYKDKNVSSSKDYDLMSTVIGGKTTFEVSWYVNTELVSIKPSKTEGFVTVDVPRDNATETPYVLSAVITDADGKVYEKKFDRVLPVYSIPDPDTELTIAQAIALGNASSHNEYTEGKYYVTGTVKEVYNTKYGNLYLEDAAGNVLTVYGTYDADGTNRYDAMANAPVAGDVITVYGIIGQYNGTPQMKNGWIQADEEGPEVGKAYLFGMVQGNLENQVYYLAGGMNGYYMETTTDAASALKVYIEETEGGYYLYCYEGEVKTYINCVVSGTYVNAKYETTASTVYTYDKASKTLVTEIGGKTYWHGTRNDKTYTTVGPCDVSYAGFYCTFYDVVDDTPTPDTGKTEITLYYYNVKGWDAVSTWIWQGGTNFTGGNWPGAAMTAVEGKPGWYSYTFEVETTEGLMVIFNNNNNGAQTADLTYTGLNYWAFETAYETEKDAVKANAPAADSVLTVTEVVYLGNILGETEAKYYVTGTIKNVYNTQYGNMYITDAEGNEVCIYGTYTADGETRYDKMTVKPVAGDTITVYGVLAAYSGKGQIKNGWITETTVGHEHDYKNVVTKKPTCTTTGLATPTCACGVTTDEVAVPMAHTLDENNLCSVCNKYVLESSALEAVPEKNTKTDGELVNAGFFTIHCSTNYRVDKSSKVFADGYASAQRLNLGGKGQVDPTGTTKNVIEFTVTEATTVRVWWVSGGEGRQVALYNEAGEIILKTDLTVAANDPAPVAEFAITAAGKYYIGGETNNNYIFKVEVDAPEADTPVEETTTTVSTTIEAYKDANGWENSTLYSELVLDSNVKVTVAHTTASSYGANTGKYYDSGFEWRIYQSEAPTITVTAVDGKTIVSVKITYNVKNSGVLTQGTTQIASGTVVEVNANSVIFSVGNTGTATNGQVKITSIEVVYE